MKSIKGFTLIELISVIIILGILSASAIGLFSSKEDFEAPLVKNQLLSSLRIAQQLALSRQNLSPSEPVTLVISQTASDWVFSIWEGDPSGSGSVFASSSIERDISTIRVSSTDFATACDLLPAGSIDPIEFDGEGNLLSSDRLRICVVGEQVNQICISSLGFAYEGSDCL